MLGVLCAVVGVVADLRGEDDVIATASVGQPGADDGPGLATGVPGHPRRIGFGGVEEVAADGDEGVEDGMRASGPGLRRALTRDSAGTAAIIPPRRTRPPVAPAARS